MVLRCSDRIAHDVCNAFDHCPDPLAPPLDYVLALKKWVNLRPESEFRGFIHNNELVGISQREVSQYFPQLVGRQEEIMFLVEGFFEQHIEEKFSLNSCEYMKEVICTLIFCS